MVKKKTTKKPLPKATKEQIDRIDELGKQIYQGEDEWEDKIRPAVFSRPMTPNRARQLIYQFMHILGDKI